MKKWRLVKKVLLVFPASILSPFTIFVTAPFAWFIPMETCFIFLAITMMPKLHKKLISKKINFRQVSFTKRKHASPFFHITSQNIYVYECKVYLHVKIVYGFQLAFYLHIWYIFCWCTTVDAQINPYYVPCLMKLKKLTY